MTEQNKLLPCPFCNKEVSIALMGRKIGYWWAVTRGTNRVEDKNCHCRLFMDSESFMDKNDGKEQKQDLINKWNTRKPMERIVEQLEEKINVINNKIDRDSTWGILGVRNGYKEAIEIVRNGGKE